MVTPLQAPFARSDRLHRLGVRAWTFAGVIMVGIAALVFMTKAAPCGNFAHAASGTCPAADSPVFARGFTGNEDGADSDSRIEGDTDTNLFYADAGNDRVGIGTASPSSKLHVSGTFQFTTLGAAANLNSQALTNANIDSGSIDGTAIGAGGASTGNFTSMTAQSYAVSGTAASVGEIRLGQNQSVQGRNNANSANVPLLGWGTASTDVLTIAAAATLTSFPGDVLGSNGIRIGADSGDNEIDDASQGAASTTLYIGNASINVTSDARVKTDFAPFSGSAVDLFRQLSPVSFKYLPGYEPIGGYSGRHVGLTAQDVFRVAPWAVNTQGDSGLPWHVKFELLQGLNVKAIQELDARLARLEQAR